MDYSILAGEIGQSQYSGMSDEEIVVALNTPGASTRRHVPARDLIATAALNGVYAAIDAGANSNNEQLRGLCRSVLVILSLTDQTVNLDDPRVVQMFGTLQQATVITPEQAAQINALATVPGVSRTQQLGLDVVVEADIQAARDWQAAQEAEEMRVAGYAALRRRLTHGEQVVLAQLTDLLESGAPVPSWHDVLDALTNAE